MLFSKPSFAYGVLGIPGSKKEGNDQSEPVVIPPNADMEW